MVIRSVMPCTPWRRTSSAIRKASTIDGALLDHLEQAIVGDDDQRVDLVAQLLDSTIRLIGTLASLEAERASDDTDCQRAQLAGDLGDHRSCAGARSATLTGRDEHHVGPLQGLLQFIAAFQCRLLPDSRVGTCAQAPGDLRPDVNPHIGVAHQQRLRIRVDGDELDSA